MIINQDHGRYDIINNTARTRARLKIRVRMMVTTNAMTTQQSRPCDRRVVGGQLGITLIDQVHGIDPAERHFEEDMLMSLMS